MARRPRNGGGASADVEQPTLATVVGELHRLQRSKTRDRLIGAGIVAVLVIAIMLNRLNANDIGDRDREGQSRDLAGLIGNCAVVEVFRTGQYNMLVSIERERPFVVTDTFAAWRDAQLPQFGPVDCTAIIPEDDRASARICLDLPDRIDPTTGEPIPRPPQAVENKACKR